MRRNTGDPSPSHAGGRGDLVGGRDCCPELSEPTSRLLTSWQDSFCYRSRKLVHIHMVSAVSNQGAIRFKLYSEAINVERFKDFLMKMIADAKGRKIILILDNLRVHHAKDLQPWLLENKHLIELRFLPAYSPEMNPDEYLNRDMKSRLSNKPMTSSAEVLESRVLGYMDYLEKEKELVQSFFSYSQVKYAA
ncbi:MAG: transposase [Fibrobacteres bacterium]|nr:transposase [Fibrobacterota bacterium]